ELDLRLSVSWLAVQHQRPRADGTGRRRAAPIPDAILEQRADHRPLTAVTARERRRRPRRATTRCACRAGARSAARTRTARATLADSQIESAADACRPAGQPPR